MRGLCFGTITSIAANGVQVLSNLVARLVVPATKASWPYGSWFPPDGIDPGTGLRNNQMGIQDNFIGRGMWGRGRKDPAGLSQQNVRGVDGNPTIADITSAGFGNQVLVGFGSTAQWHFGNNATTRTSTATPAEIGGVLLQSSGAAGQVFYTPMNIPAIRVEAFGGIIRTQVSGGNGTREVRTTGGAW